MWCQTRAIRPTQSSVTGRDESRGSESRGDSKWREPGQFTGAQGSALTGNSATAAIVPGRTRTEAQTRPPRRFALESGDGLIDRAKVSISCGGNATRIAAKHGTIRDGVRPNEKLSDWPRIIPRLRIKTDIQTGTARQFTGAKSSGISGRSASRARGRRIEAGCAGRIESKEMQRFHSRGTTP